MTARMLTAPVRALLMVTLNQGKGKAAAATKFIANIGIMSSIMSLPFAPADTLALRRPGREVLPEIDGRVAHASVGSRDILRISVKFDHQRARAGPPCIRGAVYW